MASAAYNIGTLPLRGPWQKESAWVKGGEVKLKEQRATSVMEARIRGGNGTLGKHLRYNQRNF